MNELLVELFTEEIPARMQLYARNELPKWWQNGLRQYGLDGEVEVITTPRRLTLIINNLSLVEVASEKRGPRVGADSKIVAAFAASCGAEVNELITETTPKGEFYFYRSQSTTRDIASELTNFIHHWLNNFTWPKSMRWEQTGFRWVRPIRSIIALCNSKILPVEVAGLRAGNSTYGHRVLSSAKAIEINSSSDYRTLLEKENVMLSHSDRAGLITSQARELAQQYALVWEEDQKLLTEVADLVEQPYSMMGSIDEEFMRLPSEILTTTMKYHQRYFALYNNDGKLAPYFLFVANHAQDAALIKLGNEKVLRARLSDALFYWDNDLAKAEDHLHAAVSSVTYHHDLGSIAHKAERISSSASIFAKHVGVDVAKAEQAARLCKLDLAMNTVREFPEMQGIAGRYWALHNGCNQEVADAIADHYNDLPATLLGAVLALADRIDHLVGFFAIGKAPTGSKDPFALRRAALGVLRILIHYRWDLTFGQILKEAVKQYQLQGKEFKLLDLTEVVRFLDDRVRGVWRNAGYRHDLVDAVKNAAKEVAIYRVEKRLQALAPWIEKEEMKPLLLTAKRIENILEGYKCVAVDANSITTSHPSEVKVLDELRKLSPKWEKLIESLDVQKLIEASSPLVSAIDEMFVAVKINDDNPQIREQRLNLLVSVRSLFNKWLNVGQLEG